MEHQWNQYSKVRVVGRGAHGMAILCRRKHDNTLVVIKELFTSAMSEDEKESSLNEVKVLTILRHPNIIAYYDSFTDTGHMDIESGSSNAAAGGNTTGGDDVPGGGVTSTTNSASAYARMAKMLMIESDFAPAQLAPRSYQQPHPPSRNLLSPNKGGDPVRRSSEERRKTESNRSAQRKEKIPSTLMIVMEYADGGTLGDYLENVYQTGKLLELDEIMNLFCQIALSLHHIHSLNILHRDLKTNNILISGKGRNKVLKIGDFGISKIMSTNTKAETVVGTPAYISPELCEGKPYNEKSDIWALGCVLYEIICLKKMFSSHNLPALVLKILKGAYDPIPPQFPQKLGELIQSCVELDPAKRPFMPDIIGNPFLQEYLFQTIFSVGRTECHSGMDRILNRSNASAMSASSQSHPAPAVSPHGPIPVIKAIGPSGIPMLGV